MDVFVGSELQLQTLRNHQVTKSFVGVCSPHWTVAQGKGEGCRESYGHTTFYLPFFALSLFFEFIFLVRWAGLSLGKNSKHTRGD